jgi:hypothetical protein
MYGLFFNSAGNDANLFASDGWFYLRNMAKGVEIGAYNPAGTGDSAFYVANNELYLATGTGHDVITNSGRTISLNAAQPGGNIGLYTNNIYLTSLADTYITADGNMTLRADHAGNSITSIASTITLQAVSAINLNGNISANGNLDMGGHNINNLSNINFNAGGTGILTVDSSYQPSYSASNGSVYGRIPLTQYGTANMRSNVASNVITLPVAYQDTSYVVNVSLNSNAALSNLFISATVLTSNTFAIFQNTTIGSDIRHYFYWITVGQFPTGVPP